MIFWHDEAFTGVTIKKPWGEMMTVIANDTHPPLYYIAAQLFAAPLGYRDEGIRL